MSAWDYTSNHNENGDKKKNRWHRYDKNRPKSRYGHKYSKYKTCLIMIMFICTKQQLCNI